MTSDAMPYKDNARVSSRLRVQSKDKKGNGTKKKNILGIERDSASITVTEKPSCEAAVDKMVVDKVLSSRRRVLIKPNRFNVMLDESEDKGKKREKVSVGVLRHRKCKDGLELPMEESKHGNCGVKQPTNNKARKNAGISEMKAEKSMMTGLGKRGGEDTVNGSTGKRAKLDRTSFGKDGQRKGNHVGKTGKENVKSHRSSVCKNSRVQEPRGAIKAETLAMKRTTRQQLKSRQTINSSTAVYISEPRNKSATAKQIFSCNETKCTAISEKGRGTRNQSAKSGLPDTHRSTRWSTVSVASDKTTSRTRLAGRHYQSTSAFSTIKPVTSQSQIAPVVASSDNVPASAQSSSRLNVRWLPASDRQLRSRKPVTIKRSAYPSTTDAIRKKYRRQSLGSTCTKPNLITKSASGISTTDSVNTLQTNSCVAKMDTCLDKSASVCTVEAVYVDKRAMYKKDPILACLLSDTNGVPNDSDPHNGLGGELVLADSNADCFVKGRRGQTGDRSSQINTPIVMALEGQSEHDSEATNNSSSSSKHDELCIGCELQPATVEQCCHNSEGKELLTSTEHNTPPPWSVVDSGLDNSLSHTLTDGVDCNPEVNVPSYEHKTCEQHVQDVMNISSSFKNNKSEAADNMQDDVFEDVNNDSSRPISAESMEDVTFSADMDHDLLEMLGLSDEKPVDKKHVNKDEMSIKSHGLKRCQAKSRLVRKRPSVMEKPFFETVQSVLNSRRNTMPTFQVSQSELTELSKGLAATAQTRRDSHFDRSFSLPVIEENHGEETGLRRPSSAADLEPESTSTKFYIEDMPCCSETTPAMSSPRKSLSSPKKGRPKSADCLLNDSNLDDSELTRIPSDSSLSYGQLSPTSSNSGFGFFRSFFYRTFSFRDRRRKPTVNDSDSTLSSVSLPTSVEDLSVSDKADISLKTSAESGALVHKKRPSRRKSNDVSPRELEKIAAEVRRLHEQQQTETSSSGSLEQQDAMWEDSDKVCELETCSRLTWTESVGNISHEEDSLNYKRKKRVYKHRGRTDLGANPLVSQVLKKHENNNTVLDNGKNRRMSTPHPIKNRKKNKPTATSTATTTTVKKVKPLVKSWSVPENLNQSVLLNQSAASGSTCDDMSLTQAKRWSAAEDMVGRMTTFYEINSLTYAEALWDHVTMDQEELGFRAGDVIEVINMADKDWWWGVVEGLQGWFPAAFVRLRANQEDTAEEFVQRVKDGAVDTQTVMRRYSVSFVSKDQARTNVVREILQAERDYVKQLNDVVEGYLSQARNRPAMFSPESISTIFGNIEELRDSSQEFLYKLEKCIDHSHLHLSEIGQCFLSHSSNFELYSDYCNNQPAACEELGKLQQQDKYKHFFEACRLLQQMIDIPLEGFLLTPIQKICKYPLQLAELLKYTHPQHRDYIHLERALVKMKKMAIFINERKRRMESIEKIAAWQSTVEGWEGADLLDTSSQLIHSGDLSKVTSNGWSQERIVFLFDHLLVYCKKDLLKRGSLYFKGRVNMDTCDVISIEDGRDADFGASVRNAVKLHDREKDKWYLLHAKTSSEKHKWLAAFERERRCVQEDVESGLKLPKVSKMLTTSLPAKPKGKNIKGHRNTYSNKSCESPANAPVSVPVRSVTLPRAISSQDYNNKHKKQNWFNFGWKKSKK